MRIFYNTRLDDSFLWNFWLSLSRTFFLLSVNDFHFADLGLWLGDKTLSIFGFLAFSDTAKKPVRKAVIATVEVMSIAGMIPYSLALVQALGRSKLRGLCRFGGYVGNADTQGKYTSVLVLRYRLEHPV